MTAAKRPPNAVRATWAGGYRFDTGRPGGPVAPIDGDGETGQSPPDALLSALAACSGIDVVDILAKRRTPVEKLTIDVAGERREDIPRRFVHLTLTYNLEGAGVEAVHAERAVSLAFEKYCSVAASLAPDIVAETIVVVNGVRGTPVRQRIAG
ncbi:MAG: OsmC family protein [Gemmatimonadota bacterium]|nr:OsmC family protein [Gemmatimonadota bacterium]